MKRLDFLAAALIVAVAATGCAATTAKQGAAGAGATADTGCDGLRVLASRAQEARAAAQQQQADAWKAVVPFAVVARHVQSNAARRDAQQRLDDLDAAAARQGCAHGG